MRARTGLLMVGLVAAVLATADAALAMSYAIASVQDRRCAADGSCRQAIVARGEIEVDEPERLLAFLQGLGPGQPVPTDVLISSPGGNVRGALALGFGLRRIGARVIVASVKPVTVDGRLGALATANCASACVFVLMGGRSRVVPEGSRILVHQARRIGVDQRDIVGSGSIGVQSGSETISQLLQAYARTMGVDPALIALADQIPHHTYHVLSRGEIRRFRLATSSAR